MIPIARVWRALYGDDVTDGTRSAPDQYRVTCPFHHDRNPSCDVSTRKDTFVCRSCGAGGGVCDLVERELQIDHAAALAWMATHCR